MRLIATATILLVIPLINLNCSSGKERPHYGSFKRSLFMIAKGTDLCSPKASDFYFLVDVSDNRRPERFAGAKGNINRYYTLKQLAAEITHNDAISGVMAMPYIKQMSDDGKVMIDIISEQDWNELLRLSGTCNKLGEYNLPKAQSKAPTSR